MSKMKTILKMEYYLDTRLIDYTGQISLTKEIDSVPDKIETIDGADIIRKNYDSCGTVTYILRKVSLIRNKMALNYIFEEEIPSLIRKEYKIKGCYWETPSFFDKLFHRERFKTETELVKKLTKLKVEIEC